ncbi:MAG: asparagine synthase-related protein [Haloferacaceae archaeon]
MTGIAGGTVTGDGLDRMVETMAHEEWHEDDRFEPGPFGLGVQHHGERDPGGHVTWSDGRAAGVLYGAVTNRDAVGLDDDALFGGLLRRPERLLRTIDGPFLLAVVDASDDRLLVATDKIGCRQCYYTTEQGFLFGSELTALLAELDDPQVDPQGVNDLVLTGHQWSDTTLVRDVRSLHPATLLEYDYGADAVERSRYWRPDFSPAPPTEEYFYGLVDRFRAAVDRISSTLTGDVGIWLSGGLDSRATANELARNFDDAAFDSLVAYTYDANPAGGDNPALATAVADALAVPIEEVALTPDRFVPRLEEGIALVDGMVRWSTFLNLSAVFNVERQPADVVMEGLEGALVGHHLGRHHLTGCSSLVESMYRSEAAVPADLARDLLAVDVDPLASFRREARRTDASSLAEAAVDAHYQNYYMRGAHASNRVAAGRVGTRVPYADGEFLEHVARLPLAYRMGSVPLTGGEIPFGVVRSKPRLIRALNSDLAEIRYERSSLPPTYPFPAHVVGFFASTALSRLRSQTTYGGKSMAGEWYRHHDGLRGTVNDLLADARGRSLFDGDALVDLQDAHLAGNADNVGPIAAVTTAESFLQQFVD